MTVKTIILVNPDYSGSQVFSGQSQWPVGLGYIASSLEDSNIDYDVCDLSIESPSELFVKMKQSLPQYLGIGMMSYGCKKTYSVLARVRKEFPSIKIIAGGPHVTANREKVLIECPEIDFGVVGEGEVAIREILEAKDSSMIPGLLYRTLDSIAYTGDRKFVENLDIIPFPTYKNFNLAYYPDVIHLASSRGCPHRCIFCGAPRILGKKWRKKSVAGMLKELDYWYSRGYRKFCFADSNFAVDKKRILEFCNQVISRKMSALFSVDGLRLDNVNMELLTKMKQAGFYSLVFGVESGSDKVLNNLRKGETLQQIEAGIKWSTDLGFQVTLFFLIGAPGETVEDVEMSFNLAFKYPVSNVYFFNLTPLPQTEFFDWAVQNGLIDEGNQSYPEDNFGFSAKPAMATDVLGIHEIEQLLKKARKVEARIRSRYIRDRYIDKISSMNFGLRDSQVVFLANALSTNPSQLVWHRVQETQLGKKIKQLLFG